MRIFYTATVSFLNRSNIRMSIERFSRKETSVRNRKNAAKLLQISAKKRNNTKEGAERKQRIVKKLYKNNLRTNLYLHTYKLVLPIPKNYVLLFQREKPLIHTMIDKLKSLLLEFLACFVKPEALQVSSCKRLMSLDIEKNLLSREDIFVGNKVKVLTTKYDGPIVDDFMRTLLEAYVACGKYLQNKMPLNNEFLRAIRSISPEYFVS